jgi:hypothetical protein
VGCEVIFFAVVRGGGLMRVRCQHVKLSCALMRIVCHGVSRIIRYWIALPVYRSERICVKFAEPQP